ncbi:polysaccharide deacetylase family protein [Noviherbaspirillum malthae]|uniref:polysaccharide deacetylase family protein n=1 Tax=Noviherbaspirillum malthae TaxID=1260987 RepID=UPI0018907B3C|nr:polysaccharide deacetylase family protein [Noviherbaspirillum malthae]
MNQHQPLPWRMPNLIRLSIMLHVAALIGVVLAPRFWGIALAAIIANHLVLTLSGLWPRSTWLGPNWTVLPAEAARRNEIALTIDDGPNPDVTPKVLDLLDRHGVKATFFCIGEHAARYPALCREIVRRGHAVENHSQHHRHYFSLMGARGLKREIEAGQTTLASITGSLPRFFRAPAGLRNPFLDPVLAKCGLRLAAWTRRGFDTRTGDAGTVAARLLKGLRPGSILLVHDGNCALTSAGVPVILDVLPILFDGAEKAGLRFVTLSEAFKG